MSTSTLTETTNPLKRSLTNGTENDYKRQRKEDLQYGRQYSVVDDEENLTSLLNTPPTTSSAFANFWDSKETLANMTALIGNPYLANVPTQLSQSATQKTSYLQAGGQISHTQSLTPVQTKAAQFLAKFQTRTEPNMEQIASATQPETQIPPVPAPLYLLPIRSPDQIRDDKAPLVSFNYIFQLEDRNKIARELSRLNGLEPNMNSVSVKFGLGCAYIEQKEINKAIGVFKSIESTEPDFRFAQLTLAACYFYSMDYIEAENAAKLAIKTFPHASFLAKFIIGCCLSRQQQHHEAVKYFTAVPTTNPVFAYAEFNLGSCYYNQKDYLRASIHLERGPNQVLVAAHYYSGLSYFAEKNIAKAKHHFSSVQNSSVFYSSAQGKLQRLKME